MATVTRSLLYFVRNLNAGTLYMSKSDGLKDRIAVKTLHL